MIKINKDLSKVPKSLNSKLTTQRRNEIIENEQYIDNSKYNNRYKKDDIKENLEIIYYRKCVYCEKDVGDSFYHIEHYRPKSEYYWLAFFWDNLMICCDKCNVYKNREFETDSQKVSFSIDCLKNIHNLTRVYNETERPKLVNPEFEDVENRLIFTRAGSIDSNDERIKYTITTCKIDRTSANERRKKILDDLMAKYLSRVREFQIKKDKECLGKIKGLLEDFIMDSEDPQKEYLAFRRWIVNNLRYVTTQQ
ncbi:MAG: TIGR02646 family protein [Desulfobacteraceae bacterium]|nr:TIGR02646 family protein [Desulfobacteraceae bacterium]